MKEVKRRTKREVIAASSCEIRKEEWKREE